jgi:hypothetical protein
MPAGISTGAHVIILPLRLHSRPLWACYFIAIVDEGRYRQLRAPAVSSARMNGVCTELHRPLELLMLTSFVAKNSGSACPGELAFAFLVFRTLGSGCRNIGRRWKEPLPMPPPKKTRVPASHSAGVTVPELEQSKAAVLSTLASAHSRRSYKHAIEQFIDWYCSEPRLGFNRSVVLRYRAFLEGLTLSAATVNLHLSAIRRLADEAAESGWLSPNWQSEFAGSRVSSGLGGGSAIGSLETRRKSY